MATFLAPIMLPLYQFLADRIAGRLGQPVELVVGTSFGQFGRGEADLGVICGLPYVWLAARGEVDASAIDSLVLAVALRDQPRLAASLRVVGSFGPSTIQPFVAAARLPEQTKATVRDTLLELAHHEDARAALGHGFVERFVPIDDAAYDDIRAMQAAVQAAGYTTLR